MTDVDDAVFVVPFDDVAVPDSPDGLSGPAGAVGQLLAETVRFGQSVEARTFGPLAWVTGLPVAEQDQCLRDIQKALDVDDDRSDDDRLAAVATVMLAWRVRAGAVFGVVE